MRVPLLFIQHFKGINPGEVAGYPEDMAKKIVKAQIARYYKKGEEVKPEEDKPLSEAKVMMDVENLMVGKIDDIKEELETKTSEGSYLYPLKYLEDALDFESLNKGREGMLEYLMNEMEKRANG